MARHQGAEVVNYEKEDPVATIRKLTTDIGVDRAVDAVGVDAQHAHHGPAVAQGEQAEAFAQEQKQVAPEQKPSDGQWHPGNAPSQALQWAVESLAKAGTLAVIGVYPQTVKTFPIGAAMMKNLTIRMGNCNHRRYIPHLVELVRSGAVDPTEILTRREPMRSALEAYQAFDTRQPGWIKVELVPERQAAE
jgi:threonine dehydrogenase-like Zn-dependent dehydrogenase